MKISNDDELLEYYQREISYLRRMGVEFARKYPKIAGRLELGIDQSPDPHVERLLESFAFLTARLQRNIDSELPEAATALLDILYPHYLNPVPSMSIARFVPDPKLGKMTTGYTIRQHTQLLAPSNGDITLRFRTCYPVELFPVEVSFAGFEATSKYDFLDSSPGLATVIRVRIQGSSLADLELKNLRFYLNGERSVVHSLYELLFTGCEKIAILTDSSPKPIIHTAESLRPVGFAQDEYVLPYPGNSHPQYRMLQEYFTFPEKFLFLDLLNIDKGGAKKYFDILFLLNQSPGGRITLNEETFLLGCTPIINLFNKVSEPIRLDQRLTEYPVIADSRRELSTEIYSVQRVSASSDVRNDTQVLQPFFSYNHAASNDDQKAFWHIRRLPTGREKMPGTELFLSLVDLEFNPARPPAQMIFAHTLCMNRHMAAQLPANAVLQIEEPAPVQLIYSVTKPTRQIDPPLNSSAMWRLISHLSLNYLSLAGDSQSLNAFREIMKLYDFTDDPSLNQQIAGLREMSVRQVMRRVGWQAWRGFCRGFEVTLTFDESLYVGSSAFLFASVLNRFFALYTSVNSFTQLSIKSIQRKGEWKTWDPMAGDQIIL
jgi:type VI secretion system protein ImpG